MSEEVDTYKIFRQLEERRKRRNPYTFYDKDELVDEILKLEDKITQLTNNWNELEEWIKNDKEKAMINFESGRCFNMFDILDKMKEIKEKDE